MALVCGARQMTDDPSWNFQHPAGKSRLLGVARSFRSIPRDEVLARLHDTTDQVKSERNGGDRQVASDFRSRFISI